MQQTFELKRLYGLLERDEWRDGHPFSTEVATVHQVLTHPFSSDGDMEIELSRWMQKHQPCLFGKVAAALGAIHYCFLNEDDFHESDEHVEAKIKAALASWKQRSLRPVAGRSLPAYGFVLVAASDRLALARPDGNLERFAIKLRDLWGCASTTSSHGVVHWETLCLENPQDRQIYRFTFSIDFFAAQGDGRWWHDHRSPAGLLFTANSAGYMRRYREWYEGKTEQLEWVLSTAMGTIADACDTPYGRATWLRPFVDSPADLEQVTCPFGRPDQLKKELQGKDWTGYEGHLHTDHSIRPEFFRSQPEKSSDILHESWQEDFTYIYDRSTQDHVRFMAGQLVSREEVLAEIGEPIKLVNRRIRLRGGGSDSAPTHPEVAALLELTRVQIPHCSTVAHSWMIGST